MKQSNFASNQSELIVSDRMSGKMKGMPTISTSCLCNPFCKARFENGVGVCAHCFAKQGLAYKIFLRENCERNYVWMNSKVHTETEMPHLTTNVCRGEAFGDAGSVTHAENFNVFAYANPETRIAVWTKNPNFYVHAFKRRPKAPNLIMVLSSTELNHPIEIKQEWDFFEHRFTVYTLDYLMNTLNMSVKEIDSFINCGARSCVSCQKCYRHDTEFDIRELLKADQKRFAKMLANNPI